VEMQAECTEGAVKQALERSLKRWRLEGWGV
jgi:hypothetical protein